MADAQSPAWSNPWKPPAGVCILGAMIKTQGYAAPAAKAPLTPFAFERRDVGPTDVLIDIEYCGVCHSDLHQVKDEWGGSVFPMVPGHEIVGRISKVGDKVKFFKVGDR